MPGTPVAGQDGQISIQGNIAFLDEYDIKPSGGDINTYNYESDQLDEGIFGKISCEVTVKGYFDIGYTDGPTGDPLNLMAGRIMGPILIWQSLTDALFFNWPLVRILNVNVHNQVEDRVNFEFSFKSQKIWYYPGGIAANDL